MCIRCYCWPCPETAWGEAAAAERQTPSTLPLHASPPSWLRGAAAAFAAAFAAFPAGVVGVGSAHHIPTRGRATCVSPSHHIMQTEKKNGCAETLGVVGNGGGGFHAILAKEILEADAPWAALCRRLRRALLMSCLDHGGKGKGRQNAGSVNMEDSTMRNDLDRIR